MADRSLDVLRDGDPCEGRFTITGRGEVVWCWGRASTPALVVESADGRVLADLTRAARAAVGDGPVTVAGLRAIGELVREQGRPRLVQQELFGGAP
jgi:hypothetical protein